MEDLKQIKSQVEIMLKKYPALRNPYQRKQAHIKYWQLYDGLGNFGISLELYPKLTSAETISRCIRKILEENPELRGDIQCQQASANLAEQHRLIYKS